MSRPLRVPGNVWRGVLEWPEFLYNPASPVLAELVDCLAEGLEHDPLHVFDLMNRHALDWLRTSAVRAFASAFVLGGKKDG